MLGAFKPSRTKRQKDQPLFVSFRFSPGVERLCLQMNEFFGGLGVWAISKPSRTIKKVCTAAHRQNVKLLVVNPRVLELTCSTHKSNLHGTVAFYRGQNALKTSPLPRSQPFPRPPLLHRGGSNSHQECLTCTNLRFLIEKLIGAGRCILCLGRPLLGF